MSDDEMARKALAALTQAVKSGDTESRDRWIAGYAAAIRADEREKCAQVVEQPFQRCAVSGDVVVPPYVASSIASAIRAMGDRND